MEIFLLIVLAFAFLIGLWGMTCLIGGVAKSKGPLNLIGNWIKSLSGRK